MEESLVNGNNIEAKIVILGEQSESKNCWNIFPNQIIGALGLRRRQNQFCGRIQPWRQQKRQ